MKIRSYFMWYWANWMFGVSGFSWKGTNITGLSHRLSLNIGPAIITLDFYGGTNNASRI